MAGFSMELLSNDTVREWLMCRSEPTLASEVVETAFPLRAYLQCDSVVLTSDFLVKPLGVVNGILLGYVLGDPYSFALSQNWGPMMHPACRRFVFNLETQEFLEFHWYLHNNTLLANWMKFPTEKHRLRYFVLYEAPPPGKVPYKLLSSLELVLQRTENTRQQPLSASDELFTLLPPVERSLQNIEPALKFARLLLGSFSGTFRWTQYDPETLQVTEDELYAYSVTLCARTHAEDLWLRELRRLCYPHHNIGSPVPEFHEKDSVEFLSGRNACASAGRCNSDYLQLMSKLNPGEGSVESSNSAKRTNNSPSFVSQQCNSGYEKDEASLAGSEQISFTGQRMKRGRTAFENSGLLWTHSWNFAPVEYFDTCSVNSYGGSCSTDDKGVLQTGESEPACVSSVQGYNFLFDERYQSHEHDFSPKSNSDLSSLSSFASEYGLNTILGDMNLADYWNVETSTLPKVPSFGAFWDFSQDNSDCGLVGEFLEPDEEISGTLLKNDLDWNFDASDLRHSSHSSDVNYFSQA
eukprot:jgi/Galph1/5019/GphlegSOOS_G3624.1